MRDDLVSKFIEAAILAGNVDPEQLESFNDAVVTGSVFKDDTCPVTDIDGDRLLKDGIYLYNNKKIRITDWRFGSGNFMDCYYWVWYIDEDLKDGRMTVDVRYPNGLFGVRTYPTNLVKA